MNNLAEPFTQTITAITGYHKQEHLRARGQPQASMFISVKKKNKKKNTADLYETEKPYWGTKDLCLFTFAYPLHTKNPHRPTKALSYSKVCAVEQQI